LKRIGKNEKQVTLRESILGKRQKNTADFDDKSKLQQGIKDFGDVTT
jgi:hypothetical protein